MGDIQRKGNRLTDERRKVIIDELIYFFEKERDEQIGHIAATELLNFFLETAGTDLYNRGIQDAQTALENRLDELRYDLDDLQDS